MFLSNRSSLCLSRGEIEDDSYSEVQPSSQAEFAQNWPGGSTREDDEQDYYERVRGEIAHENDQDDELAPLMMQYQHGGMQEAENDLDAYFIMQNDINSARLFARRDLD